MCWNCEENKINETHELWGTTWKLCTDCSILHGFRTIDWYKDNQELLANKYKIYDWRQI
tara:strand:+ start:243 stop:419 length:177 start_codon:yes stop_codon:yes gene_type:complete